MTTETPLRGALIGCGLVARHHLDAWPNVAGARIVALCDLDPSRLADAARRAPGARAFPSPEALFDREPLDFVEICTQADVHRPLVELAARRGAHVLCQKPAAMHRPDLVAMIDACASAGVRFMTHENWRFRPWYRALRREVDAGTIGRPLRLRVAHRDTRALRPDGLDGRPFLAGSPRMILMDMGCHVVDVARFLLGEVRAVQATTARFGRGHVGEDVATLSLEFEGGALALLDLSWCAPADLGRPDWALNETALEGEAGALKLRADGGLDLVGLDGRVERRPVDLPPEADVYVDAFRAVQAHFVDGIARGRPHETDGADTLRTMDVVWAAYRSAEEGRRVSPRIGPPDPISRFGVEKAP